MACQAVTPHLASLAKRLAKSRFHLILNHSHPTRGDEELAQFRAAGLTEAIPNLTVARGGGHPAVREPIHVPYYFLFDHTGRLARHHMCGDDHDGADGLEMIEWADKLLAKVPPIWLGTQPFVEIPDLAEKVANKRGLAAVVKQLEADAADAEGDRGEEITRLLELVEGWRDEQMAVAMSKLATAPSDTVPALKTLAKDLAGTTLAEPVVAKMEETKKAPELKTALKIEAAYEKTMRKLSKLKVPKEAAKRGIEEFRLDDPGCRKAHKRALAREAKSLRRAIKGHEELPITAKIEALIKQLEG